MRKPNPTDDVTTHLNREMWRESLGGWKAAAGVLILLGAVVCSFIRIPTDTAFLRGEVTGVVSRLSETGDQQRLVVTVDGQTRTALTRSPLIYPTVGETICLRRIDYWPFGQRDYHQTGMRFCDEAIPTTDVD